MMNLQTRKMTSFCSYFEPNFDEMALTQLKIGAHPVIRFTWNF